MASLLAPVLYLLIVVGGMFVFSYFYRKHAASEFKLFHGLVNVSFFSDLDILPGFLLGFYLCS